MFLKQNGIQRAVGRMLWRGSALPSPGEKVARRAGCGMREITVDTVEGKDLLKPYPFIGLIPLPCREVTARIPHQSAARTSLADSFSPGEAKAPHSGAVAPTGATLFRHGYRRATFPRGEGFGALNNNLSYHQTSKKLFTVAIMPFSTRASMRNSPFWA